jgi:hypothetical protein
MQEAKAEWMGWYMMERWNDQGKEGRCWLLVFGVYSIYRPYSRNWYYTGFSLFGDTLKFTCCICLTNSKLFKEFSNSSWNFFWINKNENVTEFFQHFWKWWKYVFPYFSWTCLCWFIIVLETFVTSFKIPW